MQKPASLCYLSPSRFYELFREATGLSPIEYRNRVLISRAQFLLHEGMTVREVCDSLNVMTY